MTAQKKATARQPIRGKVEHKDADRNFDVSSIQNATYDDRVDRDVFAHNERWSFAQRYIKKGMKVLDVGCGPRPAIPKLLCPYFSNVPDEYHGVDIKNIDPLSTFSWVTFHSKFDATKKNALKKLGSFDVVINLEVFEHMKPIYGLRMLREIKAAMTDSGALFFSTPVFNGKKARRHIREYTVMEMEKIFMKLGFCIERRFGTFVSWPDLKRVMSTGEYELCNELREYHCDEVMACFLAPKYPDIARNNFWILRKKPGLKPVVKEMK